MAWTDQIINITVNWTYKIFGLCVGIYIRKLNKYILNITNYDKC